MSIVSVEVVDVFISADGKFGNPLGIVLSDAVSDPTEQQKLAAHLGYSETIFVQTPCNNSGIAKAHIYTPVGELPFAGHPTIGLSWWLAQQGAPIHTLSVPAGELPVSYHGNFASIITNPSFSPLFNFQEHNTTSEVLAFDPIHYDQPENLYIWAYQDHSQGLLRSRMFMPELACTEDEATGSAATKLTAILQRNLHIIQGKGSEIFTEFLEMDQVKLSGRTAFSTSFNIDTAAI